VNARASKIARLRAALDAADAAAGWRNDAVHAALSALDCGDERPLARLAPEVRAAILSFLGPQCPDCAALDAADKEGSR
jgi:hypothetical protein